MDIGSLLLCNLMGKLRIVPGKGRIRNGIIWLLGKIQFQYLKLFTSITIESHAFCNRHCSFCPNNEKYPRREKGTMEIEIYKKIIADLQKMNYCGRISPHLYGEPLLDKRLPELISCMRKACPFAKIVVMSNGDFLNEEMLVKLINAGMDEIFITNYDDIDNTVVTSLSKKFPQNVSTRFFREVPLRNKGGLLENVAKMDNNQNPCLRPSSQLVINWKGDAIFCCNDYYGKYVLGSVKDNNLLKLWRSEKMISYQNILRKPGGRQLIDICKHCNDGE